MAAERKLITADKPESQEICFVPDGDYAGFVERNAPARDRSGPIVDNSGRTVGRHEGVHRFTIGQRKGLGVTGAKPHYVLRVLAEDRTVVVGDEGDLAGDSARVREINWLSIDAPPEPLRATVKIRYRHAAAAATIEPRAEGRALVRFDEPQRAITPGQAAVFYDGHVCLGGGWIE
jgi:tRNA-specific 2-thiouridylase